MGVLTSNFGCTLTILSSGNLVSLNYETKNLPARLRKGNGAKICSFSSQNSMKKVKKEKKGGKGVTLQSNESPFEQNGALMSSSLEDDCNPNSNAVPSTYDSMMTVPGRSNVLISCSVTSGLMAVLGMITRQASHFASTEGWQIHDCSAEVSFGFETWHLGLITGLVLMISSGRYLLLKTWPDFAESSEAANQQVLTSLQPLDYLVVACLPGFSEEILFRGALQPLFGNNLMSALLVAAVFGFLHLGGGRKYSFAIWATFVGSLYGSATIVSSSLVVPMAAHALNNLVGASLWRYSSNSSKQQK